MKKILSFILMSAILVTSCDLNEESLFLDNESVYSSGANATAALDGIYAGVVGYDLYGNVFPFLNALYSGTMVSRRGGNNSNTIFNSTIGSLLPTSGELNSNRVWTQIYTVVARANDAIFSATVDENTNSSDQMIINDVVGQAHFVRALMYFNLVNLYGEVPLRTAPATADNVHLAVSTEREVYDQIIADCLRAEELMNGFAGPQYPKSFAVNMLLAKVYMTLATATGALQDGSNYWQAAYDEARKVYGQYALVSDYASLFNENTSDGTSESIFELQSSDEASHDWVRAFTPNNFTRANTFGWLQASASFYDRHADAYPGDPRIAATFMSDYVQQNNNNTRRLYPDNPSRSSFGNAHPYMYKLGEKNQDNEDRTGNMNVVIFRYADLLLMLAEISNELQNGEQLGYVTEVLDRVGLSPHADYYGTQEQFRTAIMKEYQFELMGENQDFLTVRRRGYNWMKTNIIDFHNQHPTHNPNVDVTLSEIEEGVMRLPIPDVEINSNQLIN